MFSYYLFDMWKGFANVQKVKDLRDTQWVDRSTRAVRIKFALYNRDLR